MNMNRKISLLALAVASALACGSVMAGSDTGELTVSANLVDACDITGTPAINFGDVAALGSTGDVIANTDGTFLVACSASSVPLISASATRVMINGANNLPFTLSLTSGGTSIPNTGTGTEALGLATKDGTPYAVTLYAKILAADFQGLPSLPYTNSASPVVVTVSF